ncbi:MAG: trigger factor [Anaerolineaceae bacterium]
MKIKTELRDDHQMKVVAEFEADVLEKYKHQAARKIASRAKIPGFRPGKAPYDVILRLYGEEAITEEAKGLLVDDSYPAILDEAKINPAAPGSLEEISESEPITATFIVPLEPTVELGEYQSLRKKYAVKAVTEKQVDEFIERMRKNYATAEPSTSPAADGDLVGLKLDATLTQPTEGEKAEVLKESPLQVVIGENDPELNDFPYPGFSENLKGLSENDEKTFKYSYPEDSKYDRLRGKEVEFHALIESVKTLRLPELNDEFAQSVGDFETLAKLREMVRTQLESQARNEYEKDYFDDLIEKLVKGATIKYAPQTLEHEMEHVVESIQQDLAQQHMELDIYLKTIKKEKADWMEGDVKPAARKRLERSLVLDELAKVEKVEVGNEELQNEFTSMINEMQYSMDPKKLQKELKSERFANALAMEAASRLLNRKVLDCLKNIATGKAAELAAQKAAEPVAEGETVKPVKAKKAAKKETAELEAEAAAEKPAAPKKAVKKAAPAAEKPESSEVVAPKASKTKKSDKK